MFRKLKKTTIGEYFAENPTSFRLLVLLLLVAVVTSFVAARLQAPDSNWWASWLQNLSAEMMGGIVTFIGFEVIANRRGRFEDVISKARLGDAVALEDLRLRHKLKGQNLNRAEMELARLGHADLSECLLWVANLQGAHLNSANLNHARMGGADLRQAQVVDADLNGAILVKATLRGANLQGANLSGAQLTDANLQGVDFKGTYFDAHTVLPDHKHWTPETDLGRFVNPNHPEFWRPVPDQLGNLPRWFRDEQLQNKT